MPTDCLWPNWLRGVGAWQPGNGANVETYIRVQLVNPQWPWDMRK